VRQLVIKVLNGSLMFSNSLKMIKVDRNMSEL